MSVAAPVWLQEEAQIMALLHVALDRFDKQPGDTRQRAVFLKVEEYLSALTAGGEQADQTWTLIKALEQLGAFRIRKGRCGPYDSQWHGAKLAFSPDSETLLRAWLGREWMEPALQRWRRAVEEQAHAFPGGCEALLARRIDIAGRTAEDIITALASLGTIKHPATLRQLSASAFWGDSKVLDERGDLIAALFPELQIRERQLVVAVHLPQDCRGVLFIENQDTYTLAATASHAHGAPLAEAQNLALVYTAGFRGAAARVRSRSGALLHYAGPGTGQLQGAFEHWWYEEGPTLGPIAFWGDLDFAGMQILKSLRSRFADLDAWRPGYEALLERLRARGGYTSSSETAQGQIDPVFTGCPFADSVLLPAIRQHGQMDQECLIGQSIAT